MYVGVAADSDYGKIFGRVVFLAKFFSVMTQPSPSHKVYGSDRNFFFDSAFLRGFYKAMLCSDCRVSLATSYPYGVGILMQISRKKACLDQA